MTRLQGEEASGAQEGLRSQPLESDRITYIEDLVSPHSRVYIPITKKNLSMYLQYVNIYF